MRKKDVAVPRPVVITLRRATIEDAPTVFAWRNDPDVRAVSGSTETITMADHVKWFAKRLPPTHPESIWMVEAQDGMAIGTTRICPERDTHASVSLVIAPDYRGRGVGRQVIRAITKKVIAMERVPVARVKSDNLKSLYAFMACGYHVITTNGTFIELHEMTTQEYEALKKPDESVTA